MNSSINLCRCAAYYCHLEPVYYKSVQNDDKVPLTEWVGRFKLPLINRYCAPILILRKMNRSVVTMFVLAWFGWLGLLKPHVRA